MDVLDIIHESGWDWRIGNKILKINPPDQEAADYLLDVWLENLANSAAKIGGTVEIDWGGEFSYCITPSMKTQSFSRNNAHQSRGDFMTGNQSPNNPSSDPNLLLIIPEPEIDQSWITEDSKPTYINRIFDQENLYANPAALAAQGQKPKFIGMTAYSLNDPDELEYRCNLLSNGEVLREYEYQAWRWYFDEDANRWRLKRMYFVSNFRRLDGINLGKHLQIRGESLWLGQVLRADELSRRMA